MIREEYGESCISNDHCFDVNDQSNDCYTIHPNSQAVIDKSVIRDDRVY